MSSGATLGKEDFLSGEGRTKKIGIREQGQLSSFLCANRNSYHSSVHTPSNSLYRSRQLCSLGQQNFLLYVVLGITSEPRHVAIEVDKNL